MVVGLALTLRIVAVSFIMKVKGLQLPRAPLSTDDILSIAVGAFVKAVEIRKMGVQRAVFLRAKRQTLRRRPFGEFFASFPGQVEAAKDYGYYDNDYERNC